MRCLDLFSGCGGLSLGFQQSGFEVVAAIDNWEKAVNVYKKNFSHPCYVHDLIDEKGGIDIINKYKPDIISGGPPCQDFSPAGKRDVTLGRADLTYHFTNIIVKCKPAWFVMENVERIKKSHIIKDVTQQFIDAKYGLSCVILDASYCNTPQTRKRFFLIGQHRGKHNQLNNIYRQNQSKKQMTIRDYMGKSLNLEYYYRHPRNYNRRGIFSIDEPSPTIRGVNRPVPSGYKIHSGDPKKAVLKKTRPLTTIERSYLQTFPKDFVFEGSKTTLEQMIGNAVPVKLASFVANGIIEFLEKKCVLKKCQKNLFILPDKPLHRM